MGTFHDDLGPLHGITVVVDTRGERIVVGRCHEADDERVLLLGADVHVDGEEGLTKDDWIRRVSRLGFWEKHPRLNVPRSEVVSVRPLGEVARNL